MSIGELMDGDYEGAVVGAGKHITTGATQAGETAMKAIHDRMKSEAGPQADTHDRTGPAQNDGAEQKKKRSSAQEPGR
jgi:hypothetical protein